MTLFVSFYKLDGASDMSERIGGGAGVVADVVEQEVGQVELVLARSLRQNLAIH